MLVFVKKRVTHFGAHIEEWQKFGMMEENKIYKNGGQKNEI